jgi:hypothetical protein
MIFGANVQPHYQQGRSIAKIEKSDIEGVCDCGYITLKPQNEIEYRCGGLTVKRSSVTITDNNKIVERLSKKGIKHYRHCNACINNWK